MSNNKDICLECGSPYHRYKDTYHKPNSYHNHCSDECRSLTLVKDYYANVNFYDISMSRYDDFVNTLSYCKDVLCGFFLRFLP